MHRHRLPAFAAALLAQWLVFVTSGLLAGFMVLLGALSVPVPPWLYMVTVTLGLLVAAFRVWNDQQEKLLALRNSLVPRLRIEGVAETDGARYRVRVRNLSATTVRFGARLEAIVPAIDLALPAQLPITHHAGPHADIPAYGTALVDVFIDFPFLTLDPHERAFHGEEIGLVLTGADPAEVHVPRQRYLIRICAYPVDANTGIAAARSFHVIPEFQKPCILGDAGEPYQAPVG